MIEAAVVSAVEDLELSGDALVWSALAQRHARLVDLAWQADDVSAYLRGASQLRELVDLLPLRRPVPAYDGAEGGTNDGGPRARVLELLDSPPGVGNPS